MQNLNQFLDEVKNQVKKDLQVQINDLVKTAIREQIGEVIDRIECLENDSADHDERLNNIEYYDLDDMQSKIDDIDDIDSKIDDAIYDRNLISTDDECWESLSDDVEELKDYAVTNDTFDEIFDRAWENKFYEFFQQFKKEPQLSPEEEAFEKYFTDELKKCDKLFVDGKEVK